MEKIFKVINKKERVNSIIWMSFEFNELNVKTLRGPVIEIEEALKLIFSQEEINNVVVDYLNNQSEYKRVNPFKFITRVGMSGCRDFEIQFAQIDYGFANYRTKFLLHESCCGKINEGIHELFIYDLIDLIRYGSDSEGKPLLDFNMGQPLDIEYKEIKPVTDEELKEKGFILPKEINNKIEPVISDGIESEQELENESDIDYRIRDLLVSEEYKLVKTGSDELVRLKTRKELIEFLTKFDRKIELKKQANSKYISDSTYKILDSDTYENLGTLYIGNKFKIKSLESIPDINSADENYVIFDDVNDKVLTTEYKSDILSLKILNENNLELVGAHCLITKDDKIVGIFNISDTYTLDSKIALLTKFNWFTEDECMIILRDGSEHSVKYKHEVELLLEGIDYVNTSFTVHEFVNYKNEYKNVIIEE